MPRRKNQMQKPDIMSRLHIKANRRQFAASPAGKLIQEQTMKNNIAPEGTFHVFKSNFKPEVRKDQMGGRSYLVVPSIPIVEGVHCGSCGPLLYPAKELSKTPEVWNTKPVVVYHPERNGVGISACQPEVLESRGIGMMMNTTFEDGKLKSELWLEEDRCDKVDPRILEAVRKGEMMELSTGLFTDDEVGDGDWHGESYEAIARNYRPDHLALLPDRLGACSIEDGAGFLRANEASGSVKISQRWVDDFFPRLQAVGIDTEKLIALELSHDDLRQQLWTALTTTREDAWVEDVFDDFFVFADDGALFKQGFTVKDDAVTFEGIAERVVRVIDYQPATLQTNTQRSKPMDDKTKLIEAVIGNEHSQFGEDDRTFLETCDESALSKMNVKPPEKPEVNTITANDQPKPKTYEDLLKEADPTLQAVIRNGVNSYNAEVTMLINKITANDLCTMKEETLKEMPIENLRSIAAMAVPEEDLAVPQHMNFGGQGDTKANDTDSGPVLIPPNYAAPAKTA